MTIYVDDANRVKALVTTDDTSLIAIELTDDNPFLALSDVRKLCYYYSEEGFYPFVDTAAIDMMEKITNDSKDKYNKAMVALLEIAGIVAGDI